MLWLSCSVVSWKSDANADVHHDAGHLLWNMASVLREHNMQMHPAATHIVTPKYPHAPIVIDGAPFAPSATFYLLFQVVLG